MLHITREEYSRSLRRPYLHLARFFSGPVLLRDLGPKKSRTSFVNTPRPTTRETWGTHEVANPSKIFDENDKGIIGIGKLGANGEEYIARALHFLEEREGISSFQVEPLEGESFVAQFNGKKGSVLHVKYFGESVYHVHGYGFNRTGPAERRVASLTRPTFEVSIVELLEMPLFEKVGEVMGVRKASSETMFIDETVGVLQTKDIKDIGKVVEAFFAEEDIRIIRVNEKGQMEIRGATHRLRIEPNSSEIYRVYGYSAGLTFKPAARNLLGTFENIHVDPEPIVTFLVNSDGTQQRKVLKRVVDDYGLQMGHGKSMMRTEEMYNIATLVPRSKRVHKYDRIVREVGTSFEAVQYIEPVMAALLATEFEQNEARELRFTGAKFYEKGRLTSDGYEECIHTYQQGVATGISIAIARINDGAYASTAYNSTPRDEGAEYASFLKEFDKTEKRRRDGTSTPILVAPEQASHSGNAPNRHERRAAEKAALLNSA